jgi:hypothetical protein
MVIEEIQNVNNTPVREVNMGDIGLPCFVGLISFKPDKVAFGFLLRLRFNKAPAA